MSDLAAMYQAQGLLTEEEAMLTKILGINERLFGQDSLAAIQLQDRIAALAPPPLAAILAPDDASWNHCGSPVNFECKPWTCLIQPGYSPVVCLDTVVILDTLLPSQFLFVFSRSRCGQTLFRGTRAAALARPSAAQHVSTRKALVWAVADTVALYVIVFAVLTSKILMSYSVRVKIGSLIIVTITNSAWYICGSRVANDFRNVSSFPVVFLPLLNFWILPP
jgi:hypothetical protein